jgi:hypothetical protein
MLRHHEYRSSILQQDVVNYALWFLEQVPTNEALKTKQFFSIRECLQPCNVAVSSLAKLIVACVQNPQNVQYLTNFISKFDFYVSMDTRSISASMRQHAQSQTCVQVLFRGPTAAVQNRTYTGLHEPSVVSIHCRMLSENRKSTSIQAACCSPTHAATFQH